MTNNLKLYIICSSAKNGTTKVPAVFDASTRLHSKSLFENCYWRVSQKLWKHKRFWGNKNTSFWTCNDLVNM